MPDDIALTLQVTVPIPENRGEIAQAYLKTEDALAAFREPIQTVNGTVVEVKPGAKKKRGPQSPEGRARTIEGLRRYWARKTPEERKTHMEKMRALRWVKRNGVSPSPVSAS